MATSSSNRRNGLRWAGLIVGLAGAVCLALLFLLAMYKGYLERSSSLYVVLFYVIPFLAMVAVAWKWPLIGGILLIALGLFYIVFAFITEIGSSIPLRDILLGLAVVTLMVSPMLVSGMLFLLSRKRE